jgi:hypothetical protein
MNLETGEWTYTLETHWLGERNGDRWVFNSADLPDSVASKIAERRVRPQFRKVK